MFDYIYGHLVESSAALGQGQSFRRTTYDLYQKERRQY